MENERLPFLREKSGRLPIQPGVYIMRDKSGKIIYIGKAKVLKNRVSQYFRNVEEKRDETEKYSEKVYQMVMHVYDFDTIITDSEFEALVLECSLIKLHKPRYNILLKDDKGYQYIKIAPKEYGRITAARQKLEDDGVYIGPYISSYAVREAVDEANKVFGLPTCGKKFPEDFGKERPCLNFHIHQCMGVCRGTISLAEYNESLSQAKDFLKGGSKQVVRTLEEQMAEAAEALEFEKAAKLRDRIQAIKKVNERQKVIMSPVEEQDVIGFAQNGRKVSAVILKFRGSRLVDKEDFPMELGQDLRSTKEEFILRYYSLREFVPKQVTLDEELEDAPLLAQYLGEQKGQKVVLHVPVKGEQRQLILMAQKNAAERLSQETKRTGKEIAALSELAQLLGLPHTPKFIESYDISHFGGADMVAGMVVFEDGRPLKSAYKRFSIKTLDIQDDYAAMREVLTRRLNRYTQEKGTDSSFGILPDLILLDGGKGHVNAIRPLVEEMGFDIPVFGMVKDDKHRTRAIAADGSEIAVTSFRSAYTLVSSIQEEVHRFAIAYQKLKRRGSMLSSSLTKVPGVGDAKARALMKQFKTIRAIKEASAEELCKVKGITEPLAEKILEALNE
ncbi:MAG: excinuclease ABC subunit UvrC [Oscillospiraceae bacterium]|nr:excinuclease ABC subunit UvrC [Oscillospiraceae bacterium]